MIDKIFKAIISWNMRDFGDCGALPCRLVSSSVPCLLYIHIPFCEELCPYCSFNRIPFDVKLTSRYFQALLNEIRHYQALGFKFSNVYVGGGTPTIDPEGLHQTLRLVRSLFPVREISVETTPRGLSSETIGIMKDAGVARLSVGVQSFNDDLLKEMGRFSKYGSGDDIRKLLSSIQGIFKTLNIDMLFNLPHQTRDSLERDIDILLDLGIDQISFYPLMTASSVRKKIEHALGKVNTSATHDFYKLICNKMRDRYQASSAWCFSKGDGMIDEYIINSDNYIGAGSGAFSYYDGVIYSTIFSVREYINRIENGQSAITRHKSLTLKQRMRYDFLVKLFGMKLRRDHFVRKYGIVSSLLMMPEFTAMRMLGALKNDGEWIRVTERGMYLWIILMSEFFSKLRGR